MKKLDARTAYNAPEDWRVFSVREIALRTRNALASGPFGSDLGPADYKSSGVPVIRGSSMNHGNFVGGDFVYVSESKAELLRANTCKPGDLVLTQRGSVGQVALVPTGSYSLYLLSQSQMKASIDQNVALPSFILSYFKSYMGQKYLKSRTIQTGLPHINLGILASTQIMLPSVEEQAAIQLVLDSAEVAVGDSASLVVESTKRKRVVAERLFSSENSAPRHSRPSVHLAEFFRAKDQRATAPKPTVLSCSKTHGILPQSERFKSVIASSDLRRYKWVVPGDLVYDPMLLWDASIAFSDLSGVVSPAYETLTWIGDGLGDPRFFRALFQTQRMRQVYKTISQGTNTRRRKAPVEDFLRVSIALPPLDEQRRIADLLALMDKEIVLLRQERDALRAQKNGLLQSLLTGEIRLPEFRS